MTRYGDSVLPAILHARNLIGNNWFQGPCSLLVYARLWKRLARTSWSSVGARIFTRAEGLP